MLNQIIVVGRLRKVVDLGENAMITLECPRSFKNVDGEYESDFIDFYVYGKIKENLVEYCKQGDVIGVKGRIQTYNEEIEKETRLIAEKVTFLSTNPNLKKEEE